MKLYADPISTTSRPILLLAAESGADIQLQFIDLFKGENYAPAYTAINPNQCVPVLEDGDFRLFESSAILKYVAEKLNSPTYPKDLKARAKVNEMMDWFNTGFYRDLGYNFVYPQTLPTYKRSHEIAQSNTIAWGREKGRHWLDILDRDLIGPNKKFLCGADVTIADYFGACLLTAGEVAHCDFAPWPNVTRWLRNVKALPSWGKVNEPFYQRFVGAYKDAPMEKF
jgi:glutathione S-transferase